MKSFVISTIKKILPKKNIVISQKKYKFIQKICIIVSTLSTTLLIVFISRYMSITAWKISAGIAIILFVPYIYIIGLIFPLLEQNYKKLLSTHTNTIENIRLLKKYSCITGILYAFIFCTLYIWLIIFDVHNFFLQAAIISSVLIIPTLMMYQFVYKPARAGHLPKWLYRWLERKNPHMALPSTLTAAAEHTAVHHDASVDNAEYTVVDDAPERTDA